MTTTNVTASIMHADRIPTPSIIVDLDTAIRNVQRMAEYAKKHSLDLRPHTKTHKSLLLAEKQLSAGASGLTVAKAGEATIMSEVADDILVAYPALDPVRCAALAEMALKKIVHVAVDSTYAVNALASAAQSMQSTIGILVDIDVGHHRTGVQSPEQALELAQRIDRTPGVRLDGLMFFPGHIAEPPGQQHHKLHAVSEILSATLELWSGCGLEAAIVSGGSTPTAYRSHLIPHLSEIRPGTYIFNDRNTLDGQWCQQQDCAARIMSTVISTAVPGKVVIDAGSKTLTSDRLMHDPEKGGFGLVVDYPQARIVRLSEEHGELDVSECEDPPQIGERIQVIPNHICPCINLQDSIWLLHSDGTLEPMPIDARGKSV